jgi:hypothetical protein
MATSMKPVLRYCPICGSSLKETRAGLTNRSVEGWVNCPEHGRINIEYYRPE